MVKTTIIARVSDGVPLAASLDNEQVGVHNGIWTEMMKWLPTCFALIVRNGTGGIERTSSGVKYAIVNSIYT
ncbi:hypothetical protein [Absidia glauca]|uniref:Uncharacterized protein n=1 Tax=Absidia glauca TaxID=4829 RepID=A0A163J6V3_ABSGL|nr:hypothetical protein [Absidia glauca]